MTYGFHTHTPTAESLLMHYAAGTLPPYESMLVAAYLAVNARARAQYAAYEAEGGRMIEEADPVDVTTACLNNILAIIEPAAQRAAPAPTPAPTLDPCALPAVMRRLLSVHCPQQKLEWREVSPGIAHINIQLCRTEPRRRSLALLRVDAGRSTPAHRHAGTEITLVLEGSYSDGARLYHTGDLVILNAQSDTHSPSAGDAGCVCMILTDAPVRFENPLLRLISTLIPNGKY